MQIQAGEENGNIFATEIEFTFSRKDLFSSSGVMAWTRLKKALLDCTKVNIVFMDIYIMDNDNEFTFPYCRDKVLGQWIMDKSITCSCVCNCNRN